MTGHRRLRLLLPAAFALTPLLSVGAQAQERGEFMRDALSGIGLLEKRQDPIDYHERPPLVMPPKLDGKACPSPGPVHQHRVAEGSRDRRARARGG